MQETMLDAKKVTFDSTEVVTFRRCLGGGNSWPTDGGGWPMGMEQNAVDRTTVDIDTYEERKQQRLRDRACTVGCNQQYSYPLETRVGTKVNPLFRLLYEEEREVWLMPYQGIAELLEDTEGTAVELELMEESILLEMFA